MDGTSLSVCKLKPINFEQWSPQLYALKNALMQGSILTNCAPNRILYNLDRSIPFNKVLLEKQLLLDIPVIMTFFQIQLLSLPTSISSLVLFIELSIIFYIQMHIHFASRLSNILCEQKHPVHFPLEFGAGETCLTFQGKLKSLYSILDAMLCKMELQGLFFSINIY